MAFFPGRVFREQWEEQMLFENIGRLNERGNQLLKTERYGPALRYFQDALSLCNETRPSQQQRYEYGNILQGSLKANFMLGRYQAAFDQTTELIQIQTNWHQVYWMRALSRKMLAPNNTDDTLYDLLTGLQKASTTKWQKHTINFLHQIVKILPTVYTSQSRKTEELLAKATVRYGPEIWTEVLAKLSQNNDWESISLLMTGRHSGFSNIFKEAAAGCLTKNINVGSLLQSISDEELKRWGELLAVELLKCGSSFDGLERECRKPILHIGLEISLKTGSIKLLKYILDHFQKTPEVLDATYDGDSVFHVLVKSRKEDTIIDKTIMLLLLNYNCTPDIKDKEGKLPTDFIDNMENHFFLCLKDDGVKLPYYKAVIDEYRLRGTRAFEAGGNSDALEQLSIAADLLMKHKKYLPKDAALVFIKRSEVNYKMQKMNEALIDAKKAIRYHDTNCAGYLQKGLVHEVKNEYSDAFDVYLDGYIKSDFDGANEDKRLLFLTKATSFLSKLENVETLNVCYKRLEVVDKNYWPCVIQQLAKDAEWKSIGYLILGDTLATELHPSVRLQFVGSGDERFMMVAKGVANTFTRTDVPLTLGTVFTYLGRNVGTHEGTWLEPLLALLLFHGEEATKKSFIQTETDTFLSAVVKFSLLTDTFCVMKELGSKTYQTQSYDGNGEYILHTVAKTEPQPLPQTMKKVTDILFDFGVRNTVRDKTGQFPEHYLPKEYEKIFKRSTTSKKSDKKEKKKSKGKSQTGKPQLDLDRCEQLYKEGLSKMKSNVSAGCQKLTEVLFAVHGTPEKKTITDFISDIATEAIVQKLSDSVEDLPSSILKIHETEFCDIVRRLLLQKKWSEAISLVKQYRKEHGNHKLQKCASGINILETLNDISATKPEGTDLVMTFLVENGASLGPDGGVALLASVWDARNIQLAQQLVTAGANPSGISTYDGDAPLHAIISVANDLDEGVLALLQTLLALQNENPVQYPSLDPELQDSNGDNVYHLLAKAKFSEMILRITELLSSRKVPAKSLNNEGKFPLDYIRTKNDRNDRLEQFIRMAYTFKYSKPNITRQVSIDATQRQSSNPNGGVRTRPDVVSRHNKSTVDAKKSREVTKSIIKSMIDNLPDDFNEPESAIEHTQKRRKEKEKNPDSRLTSLFKDTESATEQLKINSDDDSSVGKAEAVERDDRQRLERLPKKVTEDANANMAIGKDTRDDNSDCEEEVEDIDPKVFDNLEWDVECTKAVWDTLRDKHIPPHIKRRIVSKIKRIGTGDQDKSLRKKLTHEDESLQLFEAKLSKASRIIWGISIAFSARRSRAVESVDSGSKDSKYVRTGKIYSEVIRIWDIVMDHDYIHSSVERIQQSYKRGETCIIQKKLKGIKQVQLPETGVRLRIPRLFFEEDEEDIEYVKEEQKQECQKFFPPATPDKTECHILKFYDVSSTLVSYVLLNMGANADLPFKVTDLESDIISLPFNTPVLLVGRSGTGKTTCCLYRLWSQYERYWAEAKATGEPLLPRALQSSHFRPSGKVYEEGNSVSASYEDGACGGSCAADSSEMYTEEESSSSCCAEVEQSQQYDHIHQLFVTKNAVLCKEVQKNFRALKNASNSSSDIEILSENSEFPNRLHDLQDSAYPLFITSRQLLLMLDASLGTDCYFRRKEDGSLKDEIDGWSVLVDETAGVFPFLNDDSSLESSSESESESEDDDVDVRHDEKRAQRGDPRTEVTYELFAGRIWPKVKQDCNAPYHASLIWTEIMSFIKGSMEALFTECGHLSEVEYQEIGQKRAPEFTGERELVFQCFKKYEHFKKQHALFDETDVIHNVYKRLTKLETCPVVIHQVYVDETQDFTQAEICLLMELSQDSNQMFLTGDTAQSIMRGISFRFEDLKSLFYNAHQSKTQKDKRVKPNFPRKVYQLTHNYRSHAGILSLASSILDILTKYFPRSFDRLERDQGLFEGAKPTLLESCSVSDLAVILRGNRRPTTSSIEFGAHQAILVANDAARDAIPEELSTGLVLTIYESKGLEFDDVLLFNFFTDSQATHEWRVVHTFIEELCSGLAEGGPRTSSLVEIDHDIIRESEQRPLKFKPNKHKVLKSELKYLYTALTRARVNIWIFDEDESKRGPMFDYFKARKLVNPVTVESIEDEGLAEIMFAKKSSPNEWTRQGEKFMKNHLYENASKCFRLAGEGDKARKAEAHQQALVALRMKGSSREKRDEYLYTAELFLQCAMPSKAVLCLKNASEWKLAAMLLKKMKQNKKAGDLFKKIGLAVDAGKCYEEVGLYKAAVNVLCEGREYEMAADTIRRYEMKLQGCSQNPTLNGEQLDALKRNKPTKTEDDIHLKSAEMYRLEGEKQKMIAALNRHSDVDIRIRFLKDKNFPFQAAMLLEEQGKWEEAAEVLLYHGNYSEALDCAKRSEKHRLTAKCLFVKCLANRTSTEETEETIKDLLEVVRLLGKTDEMILRGEAYLLMAELSGDIRYLDRSWEEFSASCSSLLSKSAGHAGQLECLDLLIKLKTTTDMKACQRVIEGLRDVFQIAKCLLQPESAYEHELAFSTNRFYGIIEEGMDRIRIYPNCHPKCLSLVPEIWNSKKHHGSVEKGIYFEPEKTNTQLLVAKFLLSRTSNWIDIIQSSLFQMRSTLLQCEQYLIGKDCAIDNDGCTTESQRYIELGMKEESLRKCTKLHQPYDFETYVKLIRVDVCIAETEITVKEGIQSLKDKTKLECINSTIAELLIPQSVACKYILDDLFQIGHHVRVTKPSVSKTIIGRLRRGKLPDHMEKYLRECWKLTQPQVNSKTKYQDSIAAQTTHIYLLVIVGIRLFNIKGMAAASLMTQFQKAINYEIQNAGQSARSICRHLSLYYQGKQEYLYCISSWFADSFACLEVSGHKIYESFLNFAHFTRLLALRDNPNMLPEMHHYLFWMEFFTTVACALLAKLQQGTIENFYLLLPASYLQQIHFVEAMFMNLTDIFSSIRKWQPNAKAVPDFVFKIRRGLVDLASTLCGNKTALHILRDQCECSGLSLKNAALAERVIVLGLVVLGNAGRSVPAELEPMIMKSVCQIDIPRDCHPRLTDLIQNLRQAKGQIEIVSILKETLLKRDDEYLFICYWDQMGPFPITRRKLETTSFLPHHFVHDATREAMASQSKPLPMRTESWEEEIELQMPEMQDQQNIGKNVPDLQSETLLKTESRLEEIELQIPEVQDQQNIGDNAKRIVVKPENPALAEVEVFFEAVKVDETMCGVCDVHFAQRAQTMPAPESGSVNITSHIEPNSILSSVIEDTRRDSSRRFVSESDGGGDIIVDTSAETTGDVRQMGGTVDIIGNELQPLHSIRDDRQRINDSSNMDEDNLQLTNASSRDGIKRLDSTRSDTNELLYLDETFLEDEIPDEHRHLLKQEHMKSPDHIKKETELQFLKNKISKHVFLYNEVTTFIKDYNLKNENVRALYSEVDTSLQRLVDAWDEFDKELHEILQNKEWSDNRKLLSALLSLVNDYDKTKDFVREKGKLIPCRSTKDVKETGKIKELEKDDEEPVVVESRKTKRKRKRKVKPGNE